MDEKQFDLPATDPAAAQPTPPADPTPAPGIVPEVKPAGDQAPAYRADRTIPPTSFEPLTPPQAAHEPQAAPEPQTAPDPQPSPAAPVYGQTPPAYDPAQPVYPYGGWAYYGTPYPYAPPAAPAMPLQQPPAPPAPPAPEGHDPRRNRRGLRVFAAVLALVIVAIGGLATGYWLGHPGDRAGKDDDVLPPKTTESQPEPSGDASRQEGEKSQFDIQTQSPAGESAGYEQVVQAVAPSIVNITVYSPDGESSAVASGIIMDAKKGYVLTNDHIYANVPAAKFLITLNDGTEFHADFVSGDARSDIAILKIQNPTGLTAAVFATQSPQVGERVLVIGQSYGYADSVTEGIVSAVDRRVTMKNGTYSERYIQTSAAINPGNSGGALVNLYGQVVGVCSAKIVTEDVESLCFAIPTDRALSVVKNLQKNGVVRGRGKLGITYVEWGTVRAELSDLPTGLYLQDIGQDSDLYNKGFAKGDIITHINGKKIVSSVTVLDVVEKTAVGESVELTIYKAASGKSETVSVKLVEAETGSSYQAEAAGDTTTSDPLDSFFGQP